MAIKTSNKTIKKDEGSTQGFMIIKQEGAKQVIKYLILMRKIAIQTGANLVKK